MHELVLEVHLQGEGLPRVHLPRVHAAAAAAAPAGLVHAVGAAGRPISCLNTGCCMSENEKCYRKWGSGSDGFALVPLLAKVERLEL